METQPLSAARAQYEADGFYLHQEPLVPDELLRRATEGMDAIRGIRHQHASKGGIATRDPPDEEQREAIAVPEGVTWEEVDAILPPGGASFHHNLTYHGSGPNLSTHMRRSFAIHLRTENSNEGLAEALDEPAHCPVIYRKDRLNRARA